MDSYDKDACSGLDGPVGPPAPAPDAPDGPDARTGIVALSAPYQVVAALALALVAVFACVHIAMVFLHVAPANTVTKQHGQAVDSWIYPEFEQNWKLFAPNPLQQNIAVQARAQIRTTDGSTRQTGWYDLSAQDAKAIDSNLLPSHTQQNELRRAWDFYTGSHDNENRPNGLRGELSERYIRRIVLLRLADEEPEGTVQRVQVRSKTTRVQPPPWSGERFDRKPVYRELEWWPVTSRDLEVRAR
ncbi:DUF5819 family protein [Streptomyces apocyni]|uniref:DUF5819 family protein n=1 Tax=Streptomyces apocyni TaxID=2654677 RepID=UPI0012EAAEF5|nr:DUF5819 family protein [Streptomyces apocyni]